MRSTRRLMSTLVLVAALGGGLAACGPGGDKADGSTGGSASPAKPADGGGKGDKGDNADCGGKPPVLPTGHTMIEIKLERDAATGFEAQKAQPTCTPNDWIYHGEGDSQHYKLASGAKIQLAENDAPKHLKPVSKDDFDKHVDGCLRDDHNAVKAPFGCYGNVYEITQNAKGDIQTIEEIWHP
ncbi:hypothetical protein [Streptomyces morookaense]|uniref:Lipoprotein n=2 Tax=Streptomyces TaxID=1883 RepID=A0A7Y7B424_STRMO|nr:hypothetical protein [Streptomyces morookaense]NVK78505.1 hypothetical protein [Streptomyces morookaense]GHF32889.1 hypothetical protein GCM10010359_39480 [Streptomyces morookaense]